MNRLRELVSGTVLGLTMFGSAIAAETAEHQEEASGGMPQLDPSTFGSQIFWLAVTFGALYFIIAKKVVPAVEGVMTERNNRIQGDLDAAAKLRTEAEEAYSAYEKELQIASANAQTAIASAKDKVSNVIADRTSKLEAELDSQIEEAASNIRASAQKALGGVEDVAAEVAIAAVERLIGVKIPADEAKSAIAAVR